MNKLVKIGLLVVASLFIFGCASEKAAPVQPQDDYGTTAKKHPSHCCKGKKCANKLGESSMETEK